MKGESLWDFEQERLRSLPEEGAPYSVTGNAAPSATESQPLMPKRAQTW